MKRRIWITKDWEMSACIMIWFNKPIWYPNKKRPCDKDSGHWANEDESGLAGSHPLSCDAFENLFKVRFRKKSDEGFIAERIISVNLSAKH